VARFAVLLCVKNFPLLVLPIVVSVALAQSSASPQPSQVVLLAQAVTGEPYYHQLRPPQPGTPPWKWRLIGGRLPDGDVTLRADGILAGTPTIAGEYRFRLEASDSAAPPQSVAYDAMMRVRVPLENDWKLPPSVQEGGISGSLVVTNSTSRTMDVTVIVLAVNEYGRATALGYQHFSFSPGTQTIPFGSSLPRGRYIVHADVVAEDLRNGAILRGRKQSNPITVP